MFCDQATTESGRGHASCRDAERVISTLTDSYGGSFVRARGYSKGFCHLMFGILALTVEQLFRLVT